MLFAVMCFDKADGLAIRLINRDDHLAYLKSLGSQVILGGPYIGGDGEKPIGSLLIIEADDEAGIKHIVDNDPYSKAGVFEKVDILPWKWTVNNPEA